MLSSIATSIRGQNRSAIALIALLIITSAAHAAADPDYSGVNDLLRGRRTLLSVNDLVIGGTVLKTSDGTKIEDKNISVLPGFHRREQDPEIMARLFDSKPPTLIYVNGSTLYAVDPITHATTSMPLGARFFRGAIASGDFLGDGFQELVTVFGYGGPTFIVNVVSPEDRKQFSAGVRRRGPNGYAFCNNSFPAVSVGDFDGDGRPEIAVACVDSAALDLYIFKVNPDTLGIEELAKQTFREPKLGMGHITMAAGRFSTTLHDQLLVGVYTDGRFVNASFDFENSFTPIQKDIFDAKVATPIQELSFQSGRFNPASPLSQVAAKLNRGRDNVQLGIIVLDQNLRIVHPVFSPLPGVACSVGGLAVGGFARTEPVPQDPSKSQRSLKLQLVISTSNCSGSAGVNIYNVDLPKGGDSSFTVDPKPVLSRSIPDAADYGLPIVAVDVQNRSVVLGEPTKIVIQATAQPSVIAAMPPMHVDFIRPSGKNELALLNLSAIPNGFRTVYETNETNASQSSSTSTNSWSFGSRASIGATFEIGSVANGLGLEVGATAQAAEDVKAITEKEFGSYRSNSFDASVKTGFADQVWYTDSRFNIYVYPVLEHMVCPGSDPSCAQKVPLTIQFSGPDKIESHKIDGNLIPWYQPPWEPGNVFSYPATYEQLRKIANNIQLLSEAQTSRTDTSTATERATWTTETTQGATAGVDQNYSYELGFSVTGAWSSGFAGGTATASLNLSGSSGFSDLNKSVTSVGRSAGIGVDKPRTFLRPASYNYPFTPYIFGQAKPGSVLDRQPLQADVTTFGLLRTAFTADPARNDAGSWWQRTYRDRPDIALNHPSRWHWREVAVENPLPTNCLNVGFGGTNMDCMDPEARRPDNLWESNFHVMRGFFISNALSAGKGPQLTTAQAGDKLRLETRVYNYSFKPLPDGSEVHVRFYAQQIDKDHSHQLAGDSVLINEVKLSAIPAFSDDDDAPLNWVLAGTDFDTTGYDGKYLIFWVVVWMQDANGNLVPEIEGHGLRSVPGALKSLAEVQEEEYSNNVGFYNSAFYVFPDRSLAAADKDDRGGEPATICIADAEISGKRIFKTQQVDVTAKLFAQKNGASGLTALFYDGDPHEGGVVFGLERVPYVAENGSYQVEAPYSAGACGKHELFVVVHEGTPDEVVRSVGKIKVDCR